ncbi:diacylglycerol/lipid kinase family protein [Woeseia oceani]|nr:diacylglycerol kinase family protein [Woeseia oceani]
MPSVPLIFNPVAGRGRAVRQMASVHDELKRLGVPVTMESSTAPGHIEKRVRQLAEAGHRAVIVAGGDGSIHEAVNGLLACDSKTALGVIPLGTGNDFAKANAIPEHANDAAELLADRLSGETPTRTVDVGRLNGRYFANGAGIGFDAKVSAIAASIRLPIGDLVYLLAVMRGLISGVATPHMKITFDDQCIEGRFTLANFSNGQWVGGMFPIAPMARINDGLLDLVYAEALSRRRILRLVPTLLKGEHMREAEVHHVPITSCHVHASSAVPAHLDGENLPPQTDFEIDLLPGALNLI